MFVRAGVYYSEEVASGKQRSLRTREPEAAAELLRAMNESARQPAINLALGRVYLAAHDEKLPTRTWADVMAAYLAKPGRASSLRRRKVAIECRQLDSIRGLKLIETRVEHFLAVLNQCRKSVNSYLRILQNLAVDYGWLPAPVLAPAHWPAMKSKRRIAITAEQHEICARLERNPEWRRFYRLLWEVGSSQFDAANLRVENINWAERMLVFRRQKLKEEDGPSAVQIGARLEAILRECPEEGFLFPGLAEMNSNSRSYHFCKLLKAAKLEGLSLHSYRYAWAQRARQAGYPQRWAQAALGHNSKAVHDAYAGAAEVVCPSLEEYESKIITLPKQVA